MKNTHIKFRIDSDKKESFKKIASNLNQNMSGLLDDFIDELIKKHS
jgi:antitoxin component of RelBE/YafQ-DinJ toxin-antitoxin module